MLYLQVKKFINFFPKKFDKNYKIGLNVGGAGDIRFAGQNIQPGLGQLSIFVDISFIKISPHLREKH